MSIKELHHQPNKVCPPIAHNHNVKKIPTRIPHPVGLEVSCLRFPGVMRYAFDWVKVSREFVSDTWLRLSPRAPYMHLWAYESIWVGGWLLTFSSKV